MRSIRGTGNRTTEMALRMAMVRAGVRGWETQPVLDMRETGIRVRPDFAFRKERIAVFADGCFWHRCRRCRKKVPTTNRAFWFRKFRRNRTRDFRQDKALLAAGWFPLRVPEHALVKDPRRAARIVSSVVTFTRDGKTFFADDIDCAFDGLVNALGV